MFDDTSPPTPVVGMGDHQNPPSTLAFRFADSASDKFWRVEWAHDAAAVNWGKTGTTGKYQLKEFGSSDECEREARKLAAAKLKKGYLPYPEFAPDAHFYVDDEEVGPHRLTSHPRFRAAFTADFYYDCADEWSPFGSDEGSDTLTQLVEDLRKNRSLDLAKFPARMIETYWDLTYRPAVDLSREAVQALVATDETNTTQSDMVTYATAFAQIKITGRIDPALKAAALNSLRRLEMAAEILGWSTASQPSETTRRMIADLEGFH